MNKGESMRNKKGYTIIEVIVSFVLIMVVMIYLLRTIVVLTNKNNDLLAYEEYSVYENKLLKDIYQDVDMAYDLEELQENAVIGNNNTITFKDINKTMEIKETENKIVYDGKIYELPENVKFRKNNNKLYDIKEVNALHKAYILTIYIKVNKNEDEIKIVYQNKKLLDYTITFDPNGGTIKSGQASVTGKYNTSATVPTVERLGYTLNGWYSPSDKKLTTNKVTITQTITYKAKWEATNYSLAYSLDGGSHGTNHPTSASYNSSFTVNNPSKKVKINYVNNISATLNTSSATVKTSGGTANYTFNGWNITGMDSTTHTYGSNTTTQTSLTGVKATTFKNLRSTNGTVTFTAKWTPPTITLPKITKNGYTCVWTSSGISNIASGGTYTPATNGGTTERTFTVSCSANTYSIAYNFNGGLPDNSSVCASENGTCSFSGTKQICYGASTNYNCKTATTSIACTNANFGDAVPGVAKKCYISPNPLSYNVTTNTFTLKNPSKVGYSFAGWTGSNGSTKQTTVTISKGSTGNKSYTANWTANKYKITYKYTYQADSTQDVTYGQNMPTPPTPNHVCGKTFVGWVEFGTGFESRAYASRYGDLLNAYCGGNINNCNDSGLMSHWVTNGKAEGRWSQDKHWNCGSHYCRKYDRASNLELHAHWVDNPSESCTTPTPPSPTTYTVTYVANCPSQDSGYWSNTATYGQSYYIYDNWFSCPGYTFIGWWGSDGTDWTNWIGRNWTWTHNFNVTLGGIWQSNESSSTETSEPTGCTYKSTGNSCTYRTSTDKSCTGWSGTCKGKTKLSTTADGKWFCKGTRYSCQ